MTRARILADYVSGGTTAAEFDYLDGVTSNVQTQFTAKAPLASPAFTGTPTGITAAHLEAGVLPSDVTGGSGLDLVVTGVKPHIIPDVLYPSYVASGTSNKLLDGVASHSGAFGTAQADGRKYYYTNINGSKPIKDPRIGAHFGSQRHKFKSIQLLEQETATQGKEVYSIDGREWMRLEVVNGEPYINYGDGGTSLTQDNGINAKYEITGYFNNLRSSQWQTNPSRCITKKICHDGSHTYFLDWSRNDLSSHYQTVFL